MVDDLNIYIWIGKTIPCVTDTKTKSELVVIVQRTALECRKR